MESVSQLAHRQSLDDIYLHTWSEVFEPNEKVSDGSFKKYWTFEIKHNQIDSHLRTDLMDIELELSVVNVDGTTPLITNDKPAIRNAAGAITTAAVAATDPTTSLENNMLYTFFKNFRMFLNGELVSDSLDLYHHKAYLYALLTLSNACKASLAASWGFYMDIYKNNESDNRGLMARVQRTSDSRKFKVRGPLFTELFCQSTPLIPCDLLLKLTRNTDQVMCHNNTKVQLHNISVIAGFSKLKPEYANSFQKTLQKSSQPYYTSEVEMSSIELKDNFSKGIFKKLTTGTLPTYVLLAFQKTSTFRGAYDEYSFKYEDFGISECYLQNHDKRYPLGGSYTFSSENPDYSYAYKSIFDASKITDLNFTLDQYPKGFFILAFELSSDFNHCSGFRHALEEQQLELFLQFHTPVSDVTVIIYMSREVVYNINALGQVSVEY